MIVDGDRIDTSNIPAPPILVGAPRLTSMPGPLATVEEAAPDSVLDGGTAGRLTFRAVSLRGDDRRYYGDTRQDAFGIGTHTSPATGRRVLIACVADGVGSEPLSHIGAAAACRRLPAALGTHAPGLLDLAPDGGAGHRSAVGIAAAVGAVADHLRAEARVRDIDPIRLSTTLTCAVFNVSAGAGSRAVVFRVGDSSAYTLRDGQFEPSFPVRANLVTSTATAALPTQPEALEVVVVDLVPGDVAVLCTDGLPVATEPIGRHLAAWWRGRPPNLAEFYWQMSFRAQSYGDDRTAVCLWVGDDAER